MTRPLSDRSTAAAQTRVAQGACVVVLAAGVALGVFGVPGATTHPAPEALKVPDPPPPAVVTDTASTTASVNSTSLGARMNLLANAPKQPAATSTQTEPPPPPPPPPAEARYIGTMSVGPRLLAIMIDAGRQRVAKVGDTLADGSKVVAISADSVTVERNGARHDITLAERQGEAISRLTPKTGRNSAAATSRPAAKPTSLTKGGGRTPGTPDGSPERLQEIIRELRESGQYKDDNALMEAAKEIFQVEAAKYEKSGGAS
ncbi:MAG: hypothetical protein HBSAPP03_09740 [Phycisphaerae bacterium]|nr:MAG: hypothetical protein HBSAPP03_09740 [Phycisphaerae bacterium]